MGKIVVSENVSLDGVVQDPTGEEGFERGGWFLRISDRDRAAWAGAGLRRPSRARPCCLAGEPRSTSPRGGHRVPARGRTG